MNSFSFAQRLDRSSASEPASEPASQLASTSASFRRSPWEGITPGLAFFLGSFALINILGTIVLPTFDANIWWIDLRPVTQYAEAPFFALLGGALIAYGIRPWPGTIRRIVTVGLVGLALLAAILNTVIFYGILINGELAGAFPIPFSLFIASVLTLILAALLRRRVVTPRPRWGFFVATVAGCAILFPLMQVFCFGKTDYRRPADAIVVLGAKAFADGTPSRPLADRVRTAVELYRQGLAPRLIFSGGPGDGAIHETESMRGMAMNLGVPGGAIVLDKHGLNTQATVDNTTLMLERIGARRVLVVSHFYHLPRIKMTYQREGWNVFTVPARETSQWTAMLYNMGREIAGLWVYYIGALWRT